MDEQTKHPFEIRLQQATTRRERIDALNALAWELNTSDLEQALQLAEEAASLAQTGEFSAVPYGYGLAESLCTMGDINSRMQKTDMALRQSLEALSLLQTYDIRELMPRALSNLAALNYLLGNYSEALDFAVRQLMLSEELGDMHQKARAALSLGGIYGELSDFVQAQRYVSDALAVFRELDEPYWVGLALTNLADAYHQMQDFDQALACVEESLEVCRVHNVHKRVYIVDLTNRGEVYLSMGQGERAITQFEEARDLARTHHQPELEADALLSMGKAFLLLERPSQAIEVLATAVTRSSEIGYRPSLYEAHKQLAMAYQTQGDYALALDHYKQFHGIKESVFGEENSSRIRNLEVLHRTQTTQKEADLYASLYEQEQTRRLLAETLQEVGQALTSTLELDEVLSQILTQLEPLVPYDRASVLLRQGDYLTFMAVRGFPEDEPYTEETVPLVPVRSEDVFQQIYESKRPLAMNHLKESPGWYQIGNLPIPESWLGVPLIYEEEVRGMLSLVRETAVPFDDESIAVATAFAAQAVIALENARLYAYVKKFNEQLEYEVRHRTQALQEAYERLERLDQAKSDFITVTAHELRTPITVIKGYGQLLQKMPDLMGDERFTRLMGGIVAGVDRLQGIVDTMLLMVKIDSGSLRIYPATLALFEVIGEVVVALAPDIAARQQTIVLDDALQELPLVNADEDLLKVLFHHLLVNAIKYTPDGGQVRVNGRSWDTPPQLDWPSHSLEIVISDTGIGIDPQELNLIFDKFYRIGPVALHSSGQTKFKGGGPGLGLTIAHGIVQAHKGLIWAESAGYDEEIYPGSAFHVVLPLAEDSNQ